MNYLDLRAKYSKFTYIGASHDESEMLYGFNCSKHVFYATSTSSWNGCPVCDAIWYVHTEYNEDAQKKRAKKYPKLPKLSANVGMLDYTTPASYKETMQALEANIIDIYPCNTNLPGESINTFTGTETDQIQFQYLGGTVVDKNSLCRWKCMRRRHDPSCQNRACMLLSARGYGPTARDVSCNNMVTCGCVFNASIHLIRTHDQTLECDIDHRAKNNSAILEASRVMEIIFGVPFIDQFVDEFSQKYRMGGFNKQLGIGFRCGQIKDASVSHYYKSKKVKCCAIKGNLRSVDQCIIVIIDWVYKNNLQRVHTEASLLCDAPMHIILELVRKYVHYANRRHVILSE